MPTGYTADVQTGKVTDFATFALQCARAFGATVMQRERPFDEKPQLREISDYYITRVANAEKRVAELNGMSTVDAERAAVAEYEKRMTSYRASVERNASARNNYNAMLAEAMRWTPPTSEHEGLKTFMIEQLTESRRFDDYTPTLPNQVSGAVWLATTKAAAASELASAQGSLAEEVSRCEQANHWITALYESLGAPAPVTP